MELLRENASRTQRVFVPINEQGGRVRDYLERLVKRAWVRPTAVTSVVTTDALSTASPREICRPRRFNMNSSEKLVHGRATIISHSQSHDAE